MFEGKKGFGKIIADVKNMNLYRQVLKLNFFDMKNFSPSGKGLLRLFVLVVFFASNLFSAFAQQKVVGGVDVNIKDYPWQVALTSSPNGSGFCGGSIIGDSWVLTAAHCVNGDSPGSLYIRCGSSSSFASGGDSYSVSQIIVHPNYSGNSYDFALVEINGEFEYSQYCLLYTSPSPRDQRGSRMPSSA